MPSTITQRLAALHERDQASLARRGARAAALIGIKTRAAVIRAFIDGAGVHDIGWIIRQRMATLQPLLAEGMVAAYLRGVARAETTVRARQGVRFSTFDEVLRTIQNRSSLTDQQIGEMVRRYGAQAVTTTGEAGTYLEEKVSAAVREAIASGLNRNAGIAAVRDAFDAAGVTTSNPYLFESIYRNEVGKTYSAGRYNANLAPEIDDILWGVELFTVGDDRVRETHEPMDGKRIPKSHPSYAILVQPPWDWGCRCSAVEIYKDDGALATPDLPSAAQIAAAIGVGFGVSWGAVFAPAA